MEKNIELSRAMQLLETTQYHQRIIKLPLYKAQGYILSKDIYATLDQPPFSKSAMDGYAFCLKEDKNASKSEPLHFDVVDCIYAGGYSDKVIDEHQAIRIMTGARVPDCCNCVIRYEDTNNSFDKLEVYAPLKIGQNICFQGEDVQKGTLLLKAGEKLDYVRLAVLSSMNIEEVEVYDQLSIALCITGSEVVLPGTNREKGQIYDSNMMLLQSRLYELGYDVSYKTVLKDDVDICAKQIEELSKQYDLIITTGGVSVGDKDIMHDALDLIHANKVFWRVNFKPGTPVLFSTVNNVPVLSLSGNPFAASVNFELLGRTLIAHMQKDPTLKPVQSTKVLTNSFLKASKKRRFIRAIYNESTVTIPTGMHSSNELRSMIGCNCIIDVKEGNTGLKQGDIVDIWMI